MDKTMSDTPRPQTTIPAEFLDAVAARERRERTGQNGAELLMRALLETGLAKTQPTNRQSEETDARSA